MLQSDRGNDRKGLAYGRAASIWGWFAGVGVIVAATGTIVVGYVLVASLARVVFIGAALALAGGLQIAHGFVAKYSRDFDYSILGGALYVAAGIFVGFEPLAGSTVITSLVAAALAGTGIMRMIIALRRPVLATRWLLSSALVSVVVAIFLWVEVPWSGLRIPGVAIGIELIVQGIAWMRVGVVLHKLVRSPN